MNLSLSSISKVLCACILFFTVFGQTIAADTKININTADVNQLIQLKHVGVKYANRIVAYREANGTFKTPEDIIMVKGIGKRILEANRDTITVSEEAVAEQE